MSQISEAMVEAAYKAFMTNKRPGYMEAFRAALQAAEAEREKVEPVAWRFRPRHEPGPWSLRHHMPEDPAQLLNVQPLYASQPPTSKEVETLLKAMEDGCWTVRCQAYPIADTGDADVGWEVVEHHMAKPHERVIAQGNTPRKALLAALHSKDGETL